MAGRRKIEDMQPLVEAFEAGSERREDFAARHDIAVSTLDYWRRRCRERSEPAFIEVQTTAHGHSSAVDLVFANGARLSYSGPLDPAFLLMLVDRAR